MRTMRKFVAVSALAATLMVAAQALAVGEGKLVNVNTASVAELSELKGIGDAKAKAIVEYREKSGPFKSVDDLQSVKGIGDKLLAKLRPQVTVGAADGSSAAVPAAAAPAAKR
jgi:competence protein ComEA